MNEFEKKQDSQDTGQQGDKPAFGQLDKEQAQPGQQQEQGETKTDELTDAGQQGDNQDETDKTGGEQQR